MHTYIDIFMGVFVIALGLGLVRAAQVATKDEARIKRLDQENEKLAEALATMFLVQIEDTFQLGKLRRENSAMWNFIRKDTALPADMLADEPIPFVPSDELVKHWEKEKQEQPYLFDDAAFRDAVDELQPIELIEQKLGGVVIEHDFHSIRDCGE